MYSEHQARWMAVDEKCATFSLLYRGPPIKFRGFVVPQLPAHIVPTECMDGGRRLPLSLRLLVLSVVETDQFQHGPEAVGDRE